MIEIRWAGVDADNRRVWGYLVDKSEESMFQSYNLVKTFWGRKGGKLYFQSTRADNVFWKNVVKKRKKYSNQDEALADKAIEEYEQIMIMRKLRHGF